MARSPKPVVFCGTSLDDLRKFPIRARRMAGFQLDRVQNGENAYDWKPMSSIASGVNEIRLRDADGVFRVNYVAKFAGAIYVLHCFQKKTQRTSPEYLALAARRYKQLVEDLR